MNEDVKKYAIVKTNGVEEFGNILKPKEDLHMAIKGRLDAIGISGSLARLDAPSKRIGFNYTSLCVMCSRTVVEPTITLL